MSEYRDRSHSPRHASHRHSHRHGHTHRHQANRSRSPDRSKHSSRHGSHHHYDDKTSPRQPPKILPLNAAHLSKHDLSTHRPLFALFLDVQKQLDIEDLHEDKVRGRWKSFVKKWNAGDLAEGWYDDQTFEKAKRGTFGRRPDADATDTPPHDNNNNNTKHPARRHHDGEDSGDDEDTDTDADEFGPSPPTSSTIEASSKSKRPGGPSVTIPSTSDLRARDEQRAEDAAAARTQHRDSLRTERQAERKLARARLDELAPRAEAGTRERQLEKKKEIAASNRAFAAAREHGGDDIDLADADIMGGGGDGDNSLGELKRLKEIEERKKTEREMRRDDILRARAAEREERMKGLREKEAKTIDMLKNIARARFGGSGGGDGGERQNG